MKIEILGTGCARCFALERAVIEAADALGLDCQIEHVSDLDRIAGYGVLMTPALVIDGEVKLVGRVPGVAELKTLLSQQESTDARGS